MGQAQGPQGVREVGRTHALPQLDPTPPDSHRQQQRGHIRCCPCTKPTQHSRAHPRPTPTQHSRAHPSPLPPPAQAVAVPPAAPPPVPPLLARSLGKASVPRLPAAPQRASWGPPPAAAARPQAVEALCLAAAHPLLLLRRRRLVQPAPLLLLLLLLVVVLLLHQDSPVARLDRPGVAAAAAWLHPRPPPNPHLSLCPPSPPHTPGVAAWLIPLPFEVLSPLLAARLHPLALLARLLLPLLLVLLQARVTACTQPANRGFPRGWVPQKTAPRRLPPAACNTGPARKKGRRQVRAVATTEPSHPPSQSVDTCHHTRASTAIQRLVTHGHPLQPHSLLSSCAAGGGCQTVPPAVPAETHPASR